MASAFLIWRSGWSNDGICKLQGLAGVSDDYEIHDGVSRLKGWPKDASAEMHPRFPKDLGLGDSLHCGSFVVISQKAKTFLEGESVGKIEFLPIKVINHKGRPVPEAYFVANPLKVVDCVDKEASVVEVDEDDEECIDDCERLVLRESAIPPDLKIFRPRFLRRVILIRRSLAERMEASGLTGLLFEEPLTYKGF